MKNIYYAIWTDAIISISRNQNNMTDWKPLSMFLMVMINTLNLAVVLIILSYFNISVIWLKVSLFKLQSINSFISFVIQFALPFVALNYFLIYSRSRYKKLIEKYPDKNGRLFASYLLGSVGLFIICIITYMLI